MMRLFFPWLRRGAAAVAGFALVFGAAFSAHAISLVGVYEKSGFEYLVNLGTTSSLSAPGGVAVNANISQFGGTTAGALFTIVSVVDRNLSDSFGVPLPNIVFTKTGTFPTGINDSAIGQAQNLVAGNGTSDSWFDLIPTVASGAIGANKTVTSSDPVAFEVKVGNDFFSAFPFSTTGTIDANGNLSISLYSAVASDAFDNTPQVITKLLNLHVTSTHVSAPEPTSLLLIGVGLAALGTVRRRA